MHGEQIRPPPGKVIKWGGLCWKLTPDDYHWHRWDPEPGGAFDQITEEEVPDELWVHIATEALLGRT